MKGKLYSPRDQTVGLAVNVKNETGNKILKKWNCIIQENTSWI